MLDEVNRAERVIERFTRTSKNYLTYQLAVIDPVVLLKPFVSAPHIWTLAQDPNDVWTEYLCTANEEPFHYENMNPEWKKLYESQRRPTNNGTTTGRPLIGPSRRLS